MINPQVRQFLRGHDQQGHFQAFQQERSRLGSLLEAEPKKEKKRALRSESKEYKLHDQEKYFQQMRMTDQLPRQQNTVNCLKQLYTEQVHPRSVRAPLSHERFQIKASIVKQNHLHLGLRHKTSSSKLHLVNRSILERANDKLYVGLYNPNYSKIQAHPQHSFTINPIRKKEKQIYGINDYPGPKADSTFQLKKDMGLAREKEFNSLISSINRQVISDMAEQKNKTASRIGKMFGKELDLDLESLQTQMQDKIEEARRIKRKQN